MGRVVLALCLLALPACAGTPGSVLLQSFLPKTYNASPQNWAVTQDGRGVVYAANTDGLLQFDGNSWRLIRIGNGLPVRSVAVDPAGTVWIGAQGDFGYLQPDGRGDPAFVSLLSFVPAEHRKFQDVWRVHLAGSAVFFGSYARIFRWQPDQRQIRVWSPGKAFGRTALVNGVLHAMSAGSGLLRLRGELLEPVPGSEAFVHTDVREVLPWAGSLLLIARSGVYRQNGDHFERVDTKADTLWKESIVNTAALLRDGRILIGTSRAGALLLDRSLAFQEAVDRKAGLHSEYVSAAAEDREGGLWLATSGGLERIQPEFRRFDEAQGLKGSVYAVTRQDGELLAGTDTGLYVLRGDRFELKGGFGDMVFELVPSQSGTLACTQRGLFRVVGGRVEPVFLTDVLYSAVESPDEIATVGRRGLFVLRRKGAKWDAAAQVPADKEEFRAVERADGGGYWVATRASILHIQFAEDGKPSVKTFGAGQGIADGFKGLYRLKGRLLVTTPKGLLEFGPDGSFRPSDLLPLDCPGRSGPVYLLREGPGGTLWVSGQGYHGVIVPGTKPEWHPFPLLRADLGEVYGLLAESDDTVWASGAEGYLIRFESARAIHPDTLTALVRRILVRSSGRSVWGGFGDNLSNLVLPWADHDLRFELAAPFFQRPERVEFQVQLQGHDDAWSAWTSDNRFDYTNLDEGTYALRVRARTATGVSSPEVRVPFAVYPPWFRTWWAYLLWGGLAVAVLWGLYRWRSSALRKDNERLEQTVADRTADIRAEERKTQELLLNILPWQVAAELKETGNVRPVQFESVTVCFTDFEGFTNSTENLPADVIVTALHQYFSQFDEIIARYGLEKLKTIGDAYMFASGLPETKPSHAVDAVMAALEISSLVSSMQVAGDSTKWRSRVGLHTGPVAAGVVGVRKFAFDIWGATVNLASRMESASEPGRVNLSERTWTEVREFIECEPRGLVITKDRRHLPMYFAVRPKPDFSHLYQQRFGYAPPVALTARAVPGR